MRSHLFILFALLIVQTIKAQNQYTYSVDLINVKKDQVEIVLKTPQIDLETVTFSFPKAIPGSYARKDYGRFIDDFTAFDKEGKKIKFEKLNVNQYKISNAKSLSSIKYKVNDTWDHLHKDFIFQPGGTNIEAGANFVMNNHGFYGYLEEFKDLPIEVTINKPAELFAATHLFVERKSTELDILKARNYAELADNPVVYARPDTSSFSVGKTKINVFVYSANNKVKSAQIAEILKPMTLAMENFFNGLPVSSYQFLYYFEDPKKGLTNHAKGEGGYGALEHNYSSLYYLPETSFINELKSMVLDVSTHEFLHILTPLNLHSAEVANFDFTSPKMSQHLWLYEGVTEYFSQLSQFQNKLIGEKKFIKALQSKIYESEEYGEFSMTEMSSRVMEDSFQKKYNSVYSRGALLAFMLDLEIREKTSGQKTLKSVVQALAKKYGPQKPFDDATFIEELVKESHSEIEPFINTHIKGASKMPLDTYFSKIGYRCIPSKRLKGYYAGRLGRTYDETIKATVFKGVEKNLLGVKEGDVLVKIQNFEVTPENVEELWEKYFDYNVNAPELYVTIKRDGVQQQLSASLYKVHMDVVNYLEAVENPEPHQAAAFKQLLN